MHIYCCVRWINKKWIIKNKLFKKMGDIIEPCIMYMTSVGLLIMQLRSNHFTKLKLPLTSLLKLWNNHHLTFWWTLQISGSRFVTLKQILHTLKWKFWLHHSFSNITILNYRSIYSIESHWLKCFKLQLFRWFQLTRKKCNKVFKKTCLAGCFWRL